MDPAREESAGSGTPLTIEGSHGELSKEERVMAWSVEDNANGATNNWDEEENGQSSMFPSARVSSSHVVQEESDAGTKIELASLDDRRNSEQSECDSKSSKQEEVSTTTLTRRKRELMAENTKSLPPQKATKVDPEAQAEQQRQIEKRLWAQAVVQKAMMNDANEERSFQLDSVRIDETLTASLDFYTGTQISNELLEDLLVLTKDNMQSMYDASNSVMWTWSDMRKRGELRNSRLRWIILRGYSNEGMSVEGIHTPESGEKGILGFVAVAFTAELSIPHAYIREIQIGKRFQGKRLGQILMRAVEKVATETKMQLMMLTVFSSNAPAIHFYQRIGFSFDETSPGPCYNLLVGPLSERSPYEIMSKTLDEAVLIYKCSECDYKCRFEDTLVQHAGLVHSKEFPFRCSVPGCGLGTVHMYQLHRHNEIKHGISPPLPAPVSAMATRRSVLQQQPNAAKPVIGEDEDQTDYVNARITFKADGRKGTVLKVDKGYYTVKVDGPLHEIVVCRAASFQGHKYVPVKKKVVDPDFELALKLQYEDGWARKSSRNRGGSGSASKH